MHTPDFNYLHDLTTEDFDVDNRPDPDTESKILKEDLIEVFWGSDNAEARVSKKKDFGYGPFWDVEVKSGGRNILLAVDYIGPSVYWLKRFYADQGICSEAADNSIREFLKVSRKLGGHVLFPRGNVPGGKSGRHLTLNQARCGAAGVFDRIDITLLCLKTYYDCPELQSGDSRRDFSAFMNEMSRYFPGQRRFEKVKPHLKRVFDSLQYYADDFAYFGSFLGFCERQSLVGSFVTQEGAVKTFAPLYPLLPANYQDYAVRVNRAIEERNRVMHVGLIAV